MHEARAVAALQAGSAPQALPAGLREALAGIGPEAAQGVARAVERWYLPLPTDAHGAPIHVGDTLTGPDGREHRISEIRTTTPAGMSVVMDTDAATLVPFLLSRGAEG